MMQRVSIFFVAVLITILATGSRALAQEKAPEFSNDLMMGDKTYPFLIADRLEYNSISGANPLVWDAQGYLGNSVNRFWFKAEGEALTTEKEGEMEFQGLYSRAIGPYFDLQAGIRYDFAYNREFNHSRAFGVIGLQGLAPYFFEVDGGLFVSEDGDISASFEAEYDLLFTQRLIGQPRLATKVAVQEVEQWGVGSGFNNVQLGFRLRYEIKREFAPYIGISWTRKLGKTADFSRLEGGEVGTLGLVGGVRIWF
jgi:copper resistance protein B